MEELRRLSILYYENTVKVSFFGIKGGVYILSSLPFFVTSLWLDFVKHHENLMMIPMIITYSFLILAKKEYNYNLIRHLSFYTHLESNKPIEHKALYLHELTYHISNSLFDTTKIFKEIIETDNKNKRFTPDNIGYYLSKFIYDPESKNRILSLFIYLISLIAILTVIKPENEFNIYDLIQAISFKDVSVYFSISFIIIIISYLLMIMSSMFIISYVINPFLLRFSFKGALLRFFISELNRYSYLEKRILSERKH